MVDDIRPRREPEEDSGVGQDTNTQASSSEPPEPATDNSNVLEQEDGFITIDREKEGREQLQIHKPHVWFARASKKERIVGGVVIAVLLIAGAAGVLAIKNNLSKETKITSSTIAKKPKPTTEASRLTGVQIPIELNKRPVTSIQLENSPDSRPQAGLIDAGVVYEAIAEGGITRFNASYLEAQPDYIGPIRSVRPYYAVLVAPFDPIFVHAGGSADGLAALRVLGLKDMDHGANGGAFRRVSDRFAPHNLYSTMGDLDRASGIRGYKSSDVKSFQRKKEKKPATPQQITAKAIDLNISSPLYNVHYDYDLATNTYHRSMGGRPHTDHRSGKLITPKVVVALAMPWSQNGIYSVYQTTGSGLAYVFQDGTIQKATWKKANDKAQFEFFDAAGKPLGLNPGQTWISLIRSPTDARSTP